MERRTVPGVLGACVLFALVGTAGASGPAATTAYLRAAAGMRTLAGWYDWGRCPWYEPWVWFGLCHAGTFQPSAGLWNSANSITTTIGFTVLARDTTYVGLIHDAFDSRRDADSVATNNVDDDGWWALAWLDASELDVGDRARSARELARAEYVFRDMDAYWDDTCGGGVWWQKKPRSYKNSIANELYMAVAARLYRATGKEEYLGKALAEYRWFFTQSGLYSRRRLIPDGIEDGTCRPDGPTLSPGTYTYNQGVVLGALVALHGVRRPPGGNTAEPGGPCAGYEPLDCALEIADLAIERLTDKDGVLTEYPAAGGSSASTADGRRPGGRHRSAHAPEGTDCLGPDCPQFKGIFVRNLGALSRADLPPAVTSRYARFLSRNAASIWEHDREEAHGKVFFGVYWQGAFGFPNATVQTSALDALVQAISAEGGGE